MDYGQTKYSDTISLNPDLLNSEFNRLASETTPWVSGFKFRDNWYGGNYRPLDDGRLDLFRQHFPDANKVLEIGCLEGGHSVRLKQLGVKEVIAFDGRDTNIKKAEFIRACYGYSESDIRFVHGDAETFDFSTIGSVGAILCIGVLYHLINPSRMIQQLSKLSNALFIWTHFNPKVSAFHPEGDIKSPTAGLSKRSLWLSKDALLRMFTRHDYRIVFQREEPNPNGPCITLVLVR